MTCFRGKPPPGYLTMRKIRAFRPLAAEQTRAFMFPWRCSARSSRSPEGRTGHSERYGFLGRHCSRDSMKRTRGSNSFGISPKAKVSRREPSGVVTRIEIVPRSGAERFEAGSVAWRKLQPSSNRFISDVSLADAADESKDHSFGTGTCCPV